MSLEPIVRSLLGDDIPIRITAFDGTDVGPSDARTTLHVKNPDALRRILFTPGELGLGRAYVAGDLELEGDVFDLLSLRDRMSKPKLEPRQLIEIAKLLDRDSLRPLPPPPEEARMRGRRHSRRRDAEAVSYHYNVSNDFYELVLGPSMTYSCAVFEHPDEDLEQAQQNKLELVCRKLELEPGQRLLDVGCGWGSLVIHAAKHFDVTAVGVTVARAQVEYGRKQVAEAGLTGQVEIRQLDYRDVTDGPFDAIASIGMFEHVGQKRLQEYFDQIFALLRPGSRFLNHAISRPREEGRPKLNPRGFIDRYVFPDGELHEVGRVISAIQRSGFEARHMESLREHYALTLRQWVANLEANWDKAVEFAGEGRARVWRLYMAGAALNFEHNDNQINQVLAVRNPQGHRDANWRLRPTFTGSLGPNG